MWIKEYIRVKGKQVTVKIDNKIVVDFIEPEGLEKTNGRDFKRLSSGIFALQGHDAKSKVYFRNICVRPI